jgi:dynein heavy chain
VQNKALKVLELFIFEIDSTKHEFDSIKKISYYPLQNGSFSGQAVWVNALSHRIMRMRFWIDQMFFIEDSIKRTAIEKFEQLSSNLKQFIIESRLKEWKEDCKELEDIVLTTRLDKYVLLRTDEKHPDFQYKKDALRPKIGHLESNFDRQLLKLTHETSAW